jgi:hypothetical protein
MMILPPAEWVDKVAAAISDERDSDVYGTPHGDAEAAIAALVPLVYDKITEHLLALPHDRQCVYQMTRRVERPAACNCALAPALAVVQNGTL